MATVVVARRQIVPTLMAPKTVPVRKDTLETDNLAKV